MTPFEIDILMHYQCSGEDHPHIRNPPPIFEQTIASFIAAGLLESALPGDRRAYVGTDKLAAYCEALQAVPLPVQKWVMPEPEPRRDLFGSPVDAWLRRAGC